MSKVVVAHNRLDMAKLRAVLDKHPDLRCGEAGNCSAGLNLSGEGNGRYAVFLNTSNLGGQYLSIHDTLAQAESAMADYQAEVVRLGRNK
jgi:hypothetical protein